jgi:hypothetical protein
VGGSAPEYEPVEFVRCFPQGDGSPYGSLPLAATPSGSVLVLGSSAPPELFPDSPGFPFLLELSPSGTELRSLALPDAPGPEVMTVAADGSVFLAGQAGPGGVGELLLPTVESGYYLAKLSPTLEVLAVTAVNSPSTQVNALHVDEQGDLVVGIAVGDFVAGSMKPGVAKYAGDTLDEEWSTVFEHEIMPALIYGMSTLPDGRIVAAGLYSRTLTIGPFVLDKQLEAQDDDAAYAGWVAWLSPEDGEPLLAQTFGGAETAGVSDLTLTSSGTVRLLTVHADPTVTLFGTTVELGDHNGAVVDLDANGAVQRAVPIGESDKGIFVLAVGKEGQTYLGGNTAHHAEDVSKTGALLRRIEADGTVGPTLSFATGRPVSEMVVDTQGGLWISGSWETPFDWNGETHEPMSPIPEEPCRYLIHTTSL